MTTFGLDIETQDDAIWCVGWADGEGRHARHDLYELITEVYGTPVFHNAKFDLSYLDPEGVVYGDNFHDTIIEAALLGYRPLNLPFLTEVFTGVKLDKTAVKERKETRFEERGEAVLEMCSLDAWASWRLHQLWADRVSPRYDHLLEMERGVTRLLMQMERRGLPVSQRKLQAAYGTITKGMARAERTLSEIGISPTDAAGFAQWFWRGKRPVTTPTGELATKKAVLRENTTEEQRPYVEAFIKWKAHDKFRSTYLDAWNGKETIHPSFNQTGTVTWRFSCTNPNLQNVPHHGHDDVPLYTLFEAPEGYVFISADYSQLQLRVLANLTQDPAMIGAYQSGRDLHAETHAVIERTGFYHRAGIQSYDHQRRIAKDTNFGIAFGITAYSLAPRIGVPVTARSPMEGVTKAASVAQELIDAFYDGYPKVKPWQDRQIEQAERDGYVETFLGRPIYVPCMLAERGKLRAHGQNQAVNGPVQGGEAEVVKAAMLRCPDYLVAQVHDELLYLVPENEAEEYRQHLNENLPDYRHDVPYVAEAVIGKSWGDLKNMEDVWSEEE